MDSYIIDTLESIQDSIATINDELGAVDTRLAVLETQMSDVLWLQKLVLGAIILSIVGAVMVLIIKKRNNKRS